MKEIQLQEARAYKSVSDIGAVTVHPLTVLAGLNGAGKSHLLQAIKEGAVRAYIDDYMLDTNEIALYDWTDFAVQTPPTATNWQIGQKRDQLWKTIQNQLRNGKACTFHGKWPAMQRFMRWNT